ncbi:hypothetical protein BGW38_003439 [Lunasporangiospora selenospora]|uniref:Uncharacterized protein n=1 Tax=Lunasporangiospora selenospora TaxID=979761 RepID=A0A9P6KCP6_9FUNG|nr:hypothetical protein BGW38_003439 [Lunasporangiospora selenospora]
MPLLLASIPDSARGLFGSLPFRGRNRSSSLPQQQQLQLHHNGHHHFLSRLSKDSTHNLSTNSLFVGPSRDAANTSDEAHDDDSRATPFSRSQATKLSSHEAVHSSASSLISLSSLSTVQSSTRETLAPKGLKRLHLFHAREWISKSSSSISLTKATDVNNDSSDHIACAQDRNDKENASVPLVPPSRKRFERAGSFSLHFRSRNGSIASLFSLRTGNGASSLGKAAGAEIASDMAAELGVARQSMSISSDEKKFAALKTSGQKHDHHDYHHHYKKIPANAVGAEERTSHPSLSLRPALVSLSSSPIMSTVAQSLSHSSNPTLPPPPPRPTLSPLKWSESSSKGSPKQTKATLSISAPIPTVSCTGLPISRPPRPPRPSSLVEVGVGKEEIACGQCRDCNQTALSTRVIPASLPVPEWSHGEVQDRLLGYESYEGVHPLPETVFIRHLLPRGASVAHSFRDKNLDEDTDEENEESLLHQNAVANELYARQRLRALRRHQSTLVRLLGDLLERERDFLCSENQFRCYLDLVAQTQSRRLKQAFVQERMDQFAARYLRDHRDAIQLTRSRPLRSKACTSTENKNEGGRWWCERCCQQGESVMTPEEKRREAVCIYQGAIVNLWEADQKMCYWLSRYMRTTRRIGSRPNLRTLATTTTATTTTAAAMTKAKSKRGAVLSMIGEEPTDCKLVHSVDIDLNTISIEGRLDAHQLSKPLPALPIEATLSKEIKASLDQWSSLSKTLPLFPAPPNFPPPPPAHQQRPSRKQARRPERVALMVAPPRPPVQVPDEIDAVLSVGRQMERQSKAKGFLHEFNQAALRAQTLVERLRMERLEYDGVFRRRKGSIITIDGRDFIW